MAIQKSSPSPVHNKPRVAVVPGSYDPVTLGHVEIIRRAAALFDVVYAVAMCNFEKQYDFSMEQRYQLLCDAVGDLPNVRVESWDGMLYEYAREKDACAIVKGIRNAEDAGYEIWQDAYNRTMYPQGETVLLIAPEQLAQVSSTEVKRRARVGEPLEGMVTQAVLQALRQKEMKE